MKLSRFHQDTFDGCNSKEVQLDLLTEKEGKEKVLANLSNIMKL